MWDLIVSVPDHCLSFYFINSHVLTSTTRQFSAFINLLCCFNCMHSRAVIKSDVSVSSVHGSKRKNMTSQE